MQFISKTNSPVTYNLSAKIGDVDSSAKLICWHTDLSANWFAAMQTHQRTNSLDQRSVSKTDDTESSAKLICRNINSLANWFAAPQTRQQTDLLKHRLINKLVRCTTNSSANWFAEAQTRQQTGSLQHKLVSELIHWNKKLLVKWFARTPQFDNENCSTLVLQFDSERWFAADNTKFQQQTLTGYEQHKFSSKHWFVANNTISAVNSDSLHTTQFWQRMLTLW